MQTTYLVDPSDVAVINARSEAELQRCLLALLGDVAICIPKSELKNSVLMFLNQGVLTVRDILSYA